MSGLRRRALAVALALAAAAAGLATWRLARTRSHASEDAKRDELAAQLVALGYVDEVTDEVDRSRRGVVAFDRGRASPGVNVYCSVHGDRAHFLDLEGRELHSIRLADAGLGSDCMLEPYGERSFLAVAWPTLSLIDFDSNVAWVSRNGHHHDVAVDGEGRIWSLLQGSGSLRERGHDLRIVDHVLARMGPGGGVELRIPLSELFGPYVSDERLALVEDVRRRSSVRSRAYAEASDVFHFNTVDVIDRDLPFAHRGDLLLCARELDLVAVVDPVAQRVVWSFGPGELDRPHHPSLLANGHLLVFDNGKRRGWSRVVEVEPASKRIVWEYRGDPPESFWSPVRGSAQALPNGNVLVTESTRGRVFEVTRGGETVWTFMNPDFAEKGRQQIYRMMRVSLERYEAWSRGAAP